MVRVAAVGISKHNIYYATAHSQEQFTERGCIYVEAATEVVAAGSPNSNVNNSAHQYFAILQVGQVTSLLQLCKESS